VEQVPGVVRSNCGRRAVVAAVEAAQEVAPVAAVESQQCRRLAQQPRREGHPLAGGEMPAGQPGVGLDDVGGDQRVLQVEGGQVPVGGQDGALGPVRAAHHGRLGRRRAHPGVVDHRREVDVVDVVGPLDDRRVEAEDLLFAGASRSQRPGGGRSGSAPRSRCRRRRARRSRGPARPGCAGPRCAPPGRPVRRARAGPEDPLGHGEGRRGPAQLSLHPPASGERPLGDDDGLAVGVVEGVLGEPRLHEVDQAGRSARVPDARRHLVDGGAVGSGPAAATATRAATTMSTGMTSTTPSGTPGNSFSSPRA
jgi:hypothetical protein